MSITRVTSIHCDGCGVWVYVDIDDTASSLRRYLKRHGWRINVKRDDGFVQDFCPHCLHKIASPASDTNPATTLAAGPLHQEGSHDRRSMGARLRAQPRRR